MKDKYAEVAEEVDAEAIEEVDVEASEQAAVELREEVDTKAEPIRVDTKPDIVETEAELGKKSRTHNLASCVTSGIRNRAPLLEQKERSQSRGLSCAQSTMFVHHA